MKRPNRAKAGGNLKTARGIVAELQRQGRPIRWLLNWQPLPVAAATGDPHQMAVLVDACRTVTGDRAVSGPGSGCAICSAGWTWARLPARLVDASLIGVPPRQAVRLLALICEPCLWRYADDRDGAEAGLLATVGCGLGRVAPVAAVGRA